MSTQVKSILAAGDEAITIDVECHMTNGLPNILIVGFANKAVDESKERIRSAFSSSQLDFPKKRITINLAPADLPKDSTSFDLPIAVAILLASSQVQQIPKPDVAFVGELGLDGSVRGVRGIIGKLLAGRKQDFTTFYVPATNAQQARLVPGITVIPVRNLRELYMHLTNTVHIAKLSDGILPATKNMQRYANDFSDVTGQARAKRALEIAAAGMHNILLRGAPGTGKSMLAKAVPSILPPMDTDEILEVTHLHSLASKNYEQILTERPFRSPHHSSSRISIIGGGQIPRPGEISLAHRGVLMFDEFPEFDRQTIEALRQPLEDRIISVSRAKDTLTFPADFMFIATCNPCPCGYYGTQRACVCSPHEIVKYQRKLSGPIIDRIDLCVDVNEVRHESLLRGKQEEPSRDIQHRIMQARKKQRDRFGSSLKSNATLSNQDLRTLISMSRSAEDMLNLAAKKLSISARSYMRIVRVAQTIADLADAKIIDTPHVSEALQYRQAHIQ